MNVYFGLFLAYMLAPKIDIPLGEIDLPLRPEDLISFAAIGLYLLSPKRQSIEWALPVRLYCVFVAINFASALINIGTNGPVGLVYSARLVQYLFWYFILYEACHRVDWWTMRRGFLGLSAILAVWAGLEYAGVITAITVDVATDRLTVNTTGPFETSVMLAMLAYAAPSLVLTGPLLVLILLTQARVTPVGMVFAYAAARPVRAVIAAAAAFVALALVAQPLLSWLEGTRIGQSDSPQRMANVMVVAWSRAPVLEDPAFFRDRLLDGPTIFRYMVDTDGDLSFRYRAVRWPTVIKSTLADPSALAIGWSPGAWSNALDNHYVRVFGETGLIGLGAFLLWLVGSILHLRPRSVAHFSLVMLAVVGVFIDIFGASKIMPMLWGFIAFEQARHPFAWGYWRYPAGRNEEQPDPGETARA